VHISTIHKRTSSLLALPIRKRLHICAGFGLGDKIFVHLFANVEITSVHEIENFHMDVIFHVWVDVTLSTLGF